MNDRLKFRGMTLGGEWVYGNLAIINKKIKPYRITIDEGYYISNKVGMPFAYPVRPETIGQCTGLKDKNGNLIYENDYIRDKWNTIYLIKWVDAKFMCIDIGAMMPDTSPRQDWLDRFGFEIIGNVHR